MSFLESVQRRAVHFIVGLKGRGNASEARQNLRLEILELRRKDSKMALLLKILSKEVHSTPISNFDFLHDEMQRYDTRLAAGNASPAFLHSHSSFYQNSFMLMNFFTRI